MGSSPVGRIVGILLMTSVAFIVGWRLVGVADVATLSLIFLCGGSVGYQVRRLLERR